VVPSSNSTHPVNDLTDVAAVATDDVWAVGFFDTGGFELHTLIQQVPRISWPFDRMRAEPERSTHRRLVQHNRVVCVIRWNMGVADGTAEAAVT
jgi:hypothetical protein